MNQTQWNMKTLIDRCTKKESMAVLFLIGILIFVILLPTSDTGDNDIKITDTEVTDMETVLSYKDIRESELEAFLESVSGVGKVNVLIYFGDTSETVPDIEGIVIAASGAGDENVRLLIMRLVMALYGIEANKVEVTLLKQ